MASHFKHTELRKMRPQRKPGKGRVGKSSAPVPDIPLQEPILITDLGKLGPRALWLTEGLPLGPREMLLYYGRRREILLLKSSLEIALGG